MADIAVHKSPDTIPIYFEMNENNLNLDLGDLDLAAQMWTEYVFPS